MLPTEPKRKRSGAAAVQPSARAMARHRVEQAIASGDRQTFEEVWTQVHHIIRRRKKFMHGVLKKAIANIEGDWLDIFKLLTQGVVGRNSIVQFFEIREFRDTLIQACVSNASFCKHLTNTQMPWQGQEDLIDIVTRELAVTFVQTQQGLEELLHLSQSPEYLSDNVLSQIDLALRLSSVRRQINFDDVAVEEEPLADTITRLDNFLLVNIQILEPNAQTWSHIISMGLPETCQALMDMDDFDGLGEGIVPLQVSAMLLAMNQSPNRQLVFTHVFEFYAAMQYPLTNIINKLPVTAAVVIQQYYDQNDIDALMLKSIETKSPSGLKVSLAAGANPCLPPLIGRALPIIMVCEDVRVMVSGLERKQMYTMLIAAGANVESKNLGGKSLLYLERDSTNMMQFFLDRGVGDVFTIQEFRQLSIHQLESTIELQKEDYMQGEDTTTFPCKCVQCGHIFNGPFLHTWLNTYIPGYMTFQSTCPLCRKKIESIEIMSKTSVDVLNQQPAEAIFKQFVFN
jgi:hypothetical protein